MEDIPQDVQTLLLEDDGERLAQVISETPGLRQLGKIGFGSCGVCRSILNDNSKIWKAQKLRTYFLIQNSVLD